MSFDLKKVVGVSYTTVAFLLFELHPATFSLQSGLQNPERQLSGLWVVSKGCNGKSSRVEVPSGVRLAHGKVWARPPGSVSENRGESSPGGHRELVSRWLIPMMRMD